MYTYKDLEQLTGLPYSTLLQWNHRGIINSDSSVRPAIFDEADACRAAWIVMLIRFHMPMDEANALFVEALQRGIKDPGIVMLLTHEGTKFISDERKLAIRKQPAVFQVIRVGAFFQEVKADLDAISKVRRFRASVGLKDHEPLQAVH
jgi:hypothetical protein